MQISIIDLVIGAKCNECTEEKHHLQHHSLTPTSMKRHLKH